MEFSSSLRNFSLLLAGLLCFWGGESAEGKPARNPEQQYGKVAELLTKRPPWLMACRRHDPNLNQCLNELFAKMFPELAKGIPALEVKPFEPLALNEVFVSKGAGPITLAGSLYDMLVSGPSNSTPTYTEFDETAKKWDFGIDIPQLLIKAKYNLQGHILILPLVGNGDCDLKLTDVETIIKTNTSFPRVGGREIVKIDNMHVSFNVGQMRVKFRNLFNGNKALGGTLNNFINQHSKEVLLELQDNVGDSLAVIFTDILNNIYRRLPTDLWLLDDKQYEAYQKELKAKS